MATKDNATEDATLGLYAEITIGASTVNDITEETVSVIGKTFEGINAAMQKGLAGLAVGVDTGTASMQAKLLEQSRIIANTAGSVRTMLSQGPIPTKNDVEGRLGEFTAKLGQLNIGLANFMSALPQQKISDMPNSAIAAITGNNRAMADLLNGLQKAANAVTAGAAKERPVSKDDTNSATPIVKFLT